MNRVDCFMGWVNANSDDETLENLINKGYACSEGASSGTEQNMLKSSSTLIVKESNNNEYLSNEKNDIGVAILGSMWWLDEELKALARAKGNAAAVSSAYQKKGKDFISEIRGSFAVAVIDKENDVIVLATDHIGTHTVFYSLTNNGGIVFGTRLGDLCCHSGIETTIDPQSLYDYIYFHSIPSPGTIFQGIKKLEPARRLMFRRGKIEVERYWLPSFSEKTDISFDEQKTEIKNILNKAVERCEPTETTGSFLSGGLDSSTITGVLAGVQSYTTNAYSIGFSEDGYDEMEYARIAAKHFGAHLNEYYVTPDDIVDAIPKIVESYDEPFGNSSAIPVYFCARLAYDNGTKTLLAGDGGDELFAGNKRYAKQKIFDLYNRIPESLRNTIIEPLMVGVPAVKTLPFIKKISSYVDQARIPMPDRMESYNFLHRTNIEEVFTSELLDTINSNHPIDLLSDVYNSIPTDSLVNRMLYLDWKFTLADNDLCKVNRMCEAAGINVQYPMLDDELIDFSASIPAELKLKGQELRYFFKKSMGDFLPQEVINKPKQGFGLPFGEWLKSSERLQEIVYSSLESLKERGIIKPDFINELINTHRGGHAAYYGTMLWVLVMLEQWFQHHNITQKN